MVHIWAKGKTSNLINGLNKYLNILNLKTRKQDCSTEM